MQRLAATRSVMVARWWSLSAACSAALSGFTPTQRPCCGCAPHTHRLSSLCLHKKKHAWQGVLPKSLRAGQY